RHHPPPGLPVPVALPAGHRRMRAGHPGTASVAARPSGRLPRGGRQRTDKGVRMKLAVIGGGSTYTPELVDGIARLSDDVKVEELGLVDPDGTRPSVVGPRSCRIMPAYRHPAPPARSTH